MTRSLLIRGGRVVDPASRTDAVLDVLLDGGRVAAVGRDLDSRGAEIVDASGLIVAPGFIDMHVHLREPGQEHKETIETGTRAAAAGGFTAVCAMPNTAPPNDRPERTSDLKARSAARAAVGVYPIAALTRDLRGAELTDMAALREAGAAAFSDDGRCIQDEALMRRALEAARAAGAPVIDHCEDFALSAGGIMHEGAVSRRLGVRGIPASAEEVMIARDIRLSEALGAPLHIAHLSTRGGVRLVREAKARGLRVTAEAAPHHLLLTEAALEERNPDFKMNPPLRETPDVEALIEAVADGTIDALATDHAPHAPEEKALGLEKAPFGIVGLETAVSLLLDKLVRPGRLGLSRFIALWTLAPAEILGWPAKGRIRPGADADLTLIDPDRDVTVDARAFLSKSRNTPFNGWTLRGAPVRTIVGGQIVFSGRS